MTVTFTSTIEKPARIPPSSASITPFSIAGMNYVLIKAIESGSIRFWVLPSNPAVTASSGR